MFTCFKVIFMTFHKALVFGNVACNFKKILRSRKIYLGDA